MRRQAIQPCIELMILTRRRGSNPFTVSRAVFKDAALNIDSVFPDNQELVHIYQNLRLNRPTRPAVITPRHVSQTLTIQQAAGNSASLTRLTDLVRESNDRLKAIEPLIPESLRPAVKAGPIDGENWCLLVNGNAAAAKIRQSIPVIQASLLRQGWKVVSIRLKVLLAKK